MCYGGQGKQIPAMALPHVEVTIAVSLASFCIQLFANVPERQKGMAE